MEANKIVDMHDWRCWWSGCCGYCFSRAVSTNFAFAVGIPMEALPWIDEERRRRGGGEGGRRRDKKGWKEEEKKKKKKTAKDKEKNKKKTRMCTNILGEPCHISPDYTVTSPLK